MSAAVMHLPAPGPGLALVVRYAEFCTHSHRSHAAMHEQYHYIVPSQNPVPSSPGLCPLAFAGPTTSRWYLEAALAATRDVGHVGQSVSPVAPISTTPMGQTLPPPSPGPPCGGLPRGPGQLQLLAGGRRIRRSYDSLDESRTPECQ